MKKIFKKFYLWIKKVQRIGFYQYLKYDLRYAFTLRGKKIRILIGGHQIFIRKGTPDLEVAISCFNGEFEILRYLFPKNYSGVIVDAGGYIGTATLALKDMFPNAKIVVIEPSLENFSILKQNLSNINNIKLIYGALIGSDEKSIQLNNRNTGEWGFTIIEAPKDSPSPKPLHETPAYRLADLINGNEKIGLLKLDIEGGELNLLRNDLTSMQNIEVVFAELHDKIITGCKDKYFEFSSNRILIKDKGEKFLSIKK